MGSKKSMIYKRLFGIYMVTIIFMLVSLDIYIINKEKHTNVENNLYIKEKLLNDINKEISDMTNSVNILSQGMYNNPKTINDIKDFLNMDKIQYLENKLNKFYESNDDYYKGTENFVKSAFVSNKNLNSISLISYSREEISKFNRKNQINVEQLSSVYIEEYNSFSNVTCEKGYVNYIRQIRDPATFKVEGMVVFQYKLDEIDKIIENYKNSYEVMILDSIGQIVYDSNSENTHKYYQYFSKLVNSEDKSVVEPEYYVNKIINPTSLVIVGKVLKDKVEKLPMSFYISLAFIDIVLFLLVEGIMYIKLKKLSNRMNNILSAMERVKSGELDIEIPVTSENDELNYISENFNEMCSRLNEHIEKSYLAELNQKNAEMIALQNQINPHFLYNTLESIRMKAICNGDREVGKMLYTLAFLFRTQLKGKNIISIRDEIDYCKKYLEIFKFRYDDNFKFNIICEEELLNKEIIKFTLQPLIENYFVHGIKLENSDNTLDICISREKDESEDIIIEIQDNGGGARRDRIDELNSMLLTRKTKGNSIGLLNAHERIVITYGNNYGIRIEENNKKGISVFVRIPSREVDENV